MNSIEKMEIRGLSFKALWWLLGSVSTIIFTVLFTYFSMINKMTTMEIINNENRKYDDLRIRTLDLKLSTLELQIKEISRRQDEILLKKLP